MFNKLMNSSFKSFSKKQAEKYIKESFTDDNILLSPEKLKKLKLLAMNKDISLGILRKKFCKKCYSLFNLNNCKIRIKKPYKIINCKNCGNLSRYLLSKNKKENEDDKRGLAVF